jgi:hypothetical protein
VSTPSSLRRATSRRCGSTTRRSIVRQALGPALEQLQGVGAGPGLHGEVLGAGLDQHVEQGVDLGRVLVGEPPRGGALLGGFAVEHVGRHGPGRAAEADQGATGIELRLDPRKGLTDRREGLAGLVGHRPHGAELREGAEPGALADLEAQFLAQGLGDEQDVGEHDGRVEGKPTQRLQGRLRRHFGVQAEGDEVGGLRPQGPILRQVAPGLAHEPHGGTRRGRAAERFEKQACHKPGFRASPGSPQSLLKDEESYG